MIDRMQEIAADLRDEYPDSLPSVVVLVYPSGSPRYSVQAYIDGTRPAGRGNTPDEALEDLRQKIANPPQCPTCGKPSCD